MVATYNFFFATRPHSTEKRAILRKQLVLVPVPVALEDQVRVVLRLLFKERGHLLIARKHLVLSCPLVVR